MAFFDDLGKKITQTGQGVVQKTRDTAEVIKLSSMISDEEKNINELYTQIGKKYFEIHSESCEEIFKTMMNGIKESQNRIYEYSEHIKKLKGIIKCPNCGGDVSYDAQFCSLCGAKLVFQKESIANDFNKNLCQSCGSPIHDGNIFCTNCGAKVEIETEDENTVAQTISEKSCPNCRTPIFSNDAFCINCGHKLNT